MGKRKFRGIGAVVAVLLIVALLGCQAVGGVNLNEMLTKQLDIRSSEGSSSVEVQLQWDDEALAAEDERVQETVKLFSRIKLQFDRMASDDEGHLSAAGRLSLSKGDIPFTLQADASKLVLNVEGVKRPLLLDIEGLQMGGILPGIGDESNALVKEAVRDVLKQVVSYTVGHLPNPPSIEASAVSVPINGAATNLMKVHAELNGKELGELIPVFLDSVLADGQGVRALIERVATWAADLPPELQEELGMSAEDEAVTEQDITEVAQELMDGLKELRDGYDEASQDEEWQQVFNESLAFKGDFYADQSLHIRKSSTELTLGAGLFAEEDIPLQSVTVRTEQETWKINEDLGLGEVTAPANALDAEEFAEMNPRRVLRQMSVDSVVYDVLKNDLQIDDQAFTLSSDWGVTLASDDDGNLYVPVKETMRQLDNSITFNAATKQVRFYDDPTEQSVLLTLGSDTAIVNGQRVQLQATVARIDGVTYMYADDLFGLLHAEYTLEDGYDGEVLMNVTRDL